MGELLFTKSRFDRKTSERNLSRFVAATNHRWFQVELQRSSDNRLFIANWVPFLLVRIRLRERTQANEYHSIGRWWSSQHRLNASVWTEIWRMVMHPTQLTKPFTIRENWSGLGCKQIIERDICSHRCIQSMLTRPPPTDGMIFLCFRRRIS